jgi:hypothetical protein
MPADDRHRAPYALCVAVKPGDCAFQRDDGWLIISGASRERQPMRLIPAYFSFLGAERSPARYALIVDNLRSTVVFSGNYAIAPALLGIVQRRVGALHQTFEVPILASEHG